MRSVQWIAANVVSARAGALVIGLVLATLVGPRDLGAFAVVMVALLAARSLDQFGVSYAVVRWRGNPDDVAPTAVTMSLLASAAIYAGCYYAAPAFAAALGAPAVTHVLRLLTLSVPIGGIVAAPSAVLQRRFPQRKATVDQVDNWVGVAVTIGLAATGHGLISVAIGRIAGSVVSAILLMVLAPRALRVGWNLKRARALLRIGLPLACSGVLAFAIFNADLIVVGHLLQLRDLGFYELALCLASWPVTLSSQPVHAAAPAVFGRFRLGPRVMGSAFLSSANLLVCLAGPVCILIGASAGNVIGLIYGTDWAPAAPALMWLAPVAALRAFYELTHYYLAARSSLRALLAFQAVLVAALLPALVVGVRTHGIVGAAIAQVVIATLALGPFYLRELKRVGIRSRVLVLRLVGWLGVFAAVGFVGHGLRRSMIPDERLDLGAAAVAALAAMSVLVYRMRGVLSAVQRTAGGVGARPAPGADRIIASSAYLFELPPHPVLAPMPRAALQAVPRLESVSAAAGTEDEQKTLGRKVSVGARWSLANTVVLRVANFSTGVVLARFVFGPRAFGLYAVSQVVLLVLLSANEMGVSLAIVRWEGDVRNFGRTVVTLSVLSSAVIYAGLYVSAPFIARSLGSPAATGMLRLMCVCVVIDGLACVPLALLDREFLQLRRMIVDSMNFVVSTGVTLWFAFSGKGAISFAWGSVTGCTVALLASIVAAPYVIPPGWNRAHVRALLHFGLPLAGASLLLLGVFNVDSIIVGATLGPAALGIYQIAFNVSSWPVNSVLEAARRVSFAGFSRVAHSNELLSDAFRKAVGIVTALAVPACVLLATLSGPLIHAVYGEKWIHAAPVLTLLAILGLMRVAYGIVYDCLAAAGRRAALLGVQGLWLAALIPALLVGAHTRGIDGVAAGHVLVAAILIGPAFLWALSRGGITVRSIAQAIWRPAVGGLLMAAVSLAVIRELGGGWLGLGAAIAAASIVYIPVITPMRTLLRAPAEPPPPAVLSEADAA